MAFSLNKTYAYEVVEEVSNSLGVNTLLQELNNYIEDNTDYDLDLNMTFKDIISDNSITFKGVIKNVLNTIFKQIKTTLESTTTLLLLILISVIISSIELNSNSEVIVITRLVIFIAISTIALKNYLEIISMFKDVINVLSNVMQVVSTFMIGVLITLGKISTIGFIEPLILFVSNIICTLTEYVVIPLFTVSIAINIVSKISVNLKMDSLSKSFRKSSLYIFTAGIGIFLMVLSFETNITKSLDGFAYKTTQNIISDAVPVVGKFLADSLDVVVGASSLVGKVGGTIGIFSMILIVSIPVIKMIIIVVLYNFLIGILEPINVDDTLNKFLKGFSDVYKDILGILIGVMTLFILSTGIMMNLMGGIS